MFDANTTLCIVIGDPIAHSLSPLIHNAAYRAAGVHNSFVFVAARVPADMLSSAIKGVRGLGIRGVSCTLPHKERVLAELDEVDDAAARMGSVNTVVNQSGKLTGHNTDMFGVVEPLRRRVDLADKRALILGAGGAARAAAFGLAGAGVQVFITNRTEERAEALARASGSHALPWKNRKETTSFDIIFNATPAGMAPTADEALLDAADFNRRHIVFDAIYNPYETMLLRNAKAAGAELVYGTEMFIEQAARQFTLYTGLDAPRDEMENVLFDHFGVKR